MAQFLWYDCTFKKQCTVPVTLTFDLWRSIIFQWIEYNPISILYKFQIDISSNSWEIKYQNIGRTHTQTHTHTQTDRQTDRVKTIPRNPLRGRGNNYRHMVGIFSASMRKLFNQAKHISALTQPYNICSYRFLQSGTCFRPQDIPSWTSPPPMNPTPSSWRSHHHYDIL